ncbi:calcium-dependent phosphotriesterase [Cristinia sonorae]|uniref:Calcium-dependent phosphotriesterase n=1 Tax=Cristinia sonorae TaxID=1940300 RepID=A0A8K0UGF1_9AGAR|nr:calcium-dependent phosphotriesterase [Cristinia sonorae]
MTVPQTVNRLDFTVFGANGPFRQSSIQEFFNPTNSTPPFFQVFDSRFLAILGPNPSIRSIASDPTFAFAHEAPIWLPDTDEFTFSSNDGGALGRSDINHNNQVAKISLKQAQEALKETSGVKPVNVTVTKLDLPDTVQMNNGGTGPLNGSLLLITSGRGPLPPSIVLSNPKPPFTTRVLLDNFFGRQFNSLNDIKIHPVSKKIFFTDAPYGFVNQFRPPLLLPNQVYRFDPSTGSVRVVADGFNKCNGIAFSQDGKSAFISDTGVNSGVFGIDQTAPATIYKFDVEPQTQAFINRRVFAYIDTGIPDGLQLDTKGNVYTGTGDGVQVRLSTMKVFAPDGTLLGKFFIGTTSANMAFAGKGRLVILGETSIFLAEIAASGFNLAH